MADDPVGKRTAEDDHRRVYGSGDRQRQSPQLIDGSLQPGLHDGMIGVSAIDIFQPSDVDSRRKQIIA